MHTFAFETVGRSGKNPKMFVFPDLAATAEWRCNQARLGQQTSETDPKSQSRGCYVIFSETTGRILFIYGSKEAEFCPLLYACDKPSESWCCCALFSSKSRHYTTSLTVL